MTEEQVAAAASQGKREKKGLYVKAWLKRRKNLELYGTLLVELRLEQEYNYNILLRMTSEHFEEIFQLIKDDILKENTSLRELNVIGLFPSYKLEEIELILFLKSCIIQIFVHQVCMNSLFYTGKLVESNKLFHTNRLI